MGMKYIINERQLRLVEEVIELNGHKARADWGVDFGDFSPEEKQDFDNYVNYLEEIYLKSNPNLKNILRNPKLPVSIQKHETYLCIKFGAISNQIAVYLSRYKNVYGSKKGFSVYIRFQQYKSDQGFGGAYLIPSLKDLFNCDNISRNIPYVHYEY